MTSDVLVKWGKCEWRNCVEGADPTVDVGTVNTLLLVMIMRISRDGITFCAGV